MIRLLLLFVCCFCMQQLPAQTDAQVRSRKIRSVETEITETRKGKEEKFKIRETYFKGGLKTYEKWNQEGTKVISESHWVRKDGQDSRMTENNPSDDQAQKIRLYSYDRFGKLIKEEITDASGKVLEYEEIKYGVRGEKLSEVSYDANKKIMRETTYDYDNKGMLLRKVTKDSEGKVIYEKKVAYEY